MSKKHKKRFKSPSIRPIAPPLPAAPPIEQVDLVNTPMPEVNQYSPRHFAELRRIALIFICLCALLLVITYSNTRVGSLSRLGHVVDRMLHIAE